MALLVYYHKNTKEGIKMRRQIQFKVALSQNEKSKLEAMSRDNKLSARISKHVLILLALNNKDESGLNYRQVASALNTTAATVAKTAKDYAISYHLNQHHAAGRK